MSQLGLFIITVCSGIFIYQFTFLQAFTDFPVAKQHTPYLINLLDVNLTNMVYAKTLVGLYLSNTLDLLFILHMALIFKHRMQ